MDTHAGGTSGTDMRLHWEGRLSEETLVAIVELLDCAADDGGLLGHTHPMSPSQAEAFKRGLRATLPTGEAHALLGTVDEELIFFCLMTPSPMPTCQHRAELSKGMLHPDYRRQRLLPLVVEEVLRRSDELQIEQLVLDVREGSHAHQLWQRFGFETYGVLDDYARVDGQRHRGHFMSQTVAGLRQRALASSAPFGR